MDTIIFTDEGDEEAGVRIIINGRDFIQMVREVEQPFAVAEDHPDLAGAYGYFGPMFVFAPSQYFYGEPVNDWTDGPGRIFLLSCTCGIPGCWALSARIQFNAQEVIWSDFKQIRRGADSPFGEWRYDDLGPFRFDRQLYDQQLAQAPAERKPRPQTRNTRLADVFNLGFRAGANARAATGQIKPANSEPASIPPAPELCQDAEESDIWMEGYLTGFKIGASDAELATVDIPGAHGMVSGFDQQFLEQSGRLKKIS